LVSSTGKKMDFEIRKEEAKDIEQLRGISKTAFPTDAESKLVDILRATGKAIISLVAAKGDEVLGHILFSPVTTAPPIQEKGIGLAPVAVRLNAQTQGIGSQLIREGLRLCQELEYDYCVVLGSPGYYRRFGFEKASKFNLQNEYGVDDEFMVIRFSNQVMPEKEMTPLLVRYSPEFFLFSL
jgi:putative acetyltransferase